MRTLDRPSILVVDDDCSGCEVLATLLATRGFRVRAAKDGQEALDLLQSGVRPDLLIIDLKLQKVSGPELLRYTHEDPELRCIPTIIVTGTAGPVAAIADEVFIKPVDIARLLDSVKRLVGGPA
jgi:CheY-like chemotaxis protein